MIPPAEYRQRLARAQAALGGAGADVLLVSVGKDMPYLCAYETEPSERMTMAVIPASGRCTIVVPELEAPRVPDLGLVEVVSWAETEDPLDIVAELIGDAGTARFGNETWSSFLLGLQDRLPQRRFQPAAPLMAELRRRKTPAEIELLRAAGAAADRVAVRLAETRFSGRSEISLAREIADMTVAEGHDAAEFTIVASGPASASPHHLPTDRLMASGDMVVVDFGGSVAGYHSDTTRTFHIGPPGSEAVQVHDVVRRAQAAATAAAAVGVAPEAVDAAARDVIVGAGYGDFFIHRTGHGIGLDLHEEPYLVAGNTAPLEEGMAFSIEPGVYLPGRLGVRIEDIVVLGSGGAEPLNDSNRGLVVVA